VREKRDGLDLLRRGVGCWRITRTAQETCGVLGVLPALDGAGKNNTIRHVMTELNPQDVRVPPLQDAHSPRN
jgi:polyphosphate kinase 2 (PPK2 family)